jgi:hypothetical protein
MTIALTVIILLLFAVSFSYGVFGMVKWKGRRKRGLFISLLSIPVAIVLIGVVSKLFPVDQSAFEESGFATIEEFREAREAGYSDKTAYDAYLRAEEAKCRTSLSCWGDRFVVQSAVRCADAVPKLANYDHEWTDGVLDLKFPNMKWKDREAGIITYSGDAIKFQNAFGAWSNYIYECDFDTASESVLEVRANPGQF